MRRIAIPSLLLAAAAVFVLPGEGRSGDAEFTINFGTVAPEGTPWADQLYDIQKRIQKDSEGRIQVRIFLGGTLGGEVEMTQDIVEGGRLQGGGFSTAAVAEGANVPELQLPELPYLFRSDAEADHILDNVLYEPIKKKMGRRGLHLNMWAINGWRSFYTKNAPVTSLEILRGQKMRVQEAPVHKAMYKAFGVQAEPIAVPDVLDALNRGAVDGFDNTTLFGQASGWFEPTKYYTLSKHIFQPAVILYSKDFFDALPADLQTVVEGDWRAEQKKGRDGVRSLEASLIENYKEMGLTVYEPTAAELAPFIEAAQTVHTEMRDQVGGDLLDTVNAELATFRAAQ
ncbi:MAG: TRAP transporter substrate-binding protein [Proteobacteria bacterium]|nr:TRAP transporter substrate-binding protein [Pseudomonadota bacterium]